MSEGPSDGRSAAPKPEPESRRVQKLAPASPGQPRMRQPARPHARVVTHRPGPGAPVFVCSVVRLRNYTGVFLLLAGRKVTRTGQAPNGIESVPAHRSGHPSSWTAPPSVCASSSAASAPTTRSTRSDDAGLVIGGRTVTRRRPDVRRRTHGAPASTRPARTSSSCSGAPSPIPHGVLEPASKDRRPCFAPAEAIRRSRGRRAGRRGLAPPRP